MANELRIYNIPEQIEAAMNAVHIDEETGEVIGNDAVDSIIKESQEKVVNCAMYLKERKGVLVAMKKAADDIYARMKVEEKRQSWLEQCVVDAMGYFGVDRIDAPEISVRLRKSESVQIDEEKMISSDFVIIKTTASPNKVAIKSALKAGLSVEGARLVKKINLSLK